MISIITPFQLGALDAISTGQHRGRVFVPGLGSAGGAGGGLPGLPHTHLSGNAYRLRLLFFGWVYSLFLMVLKGNQKESQQFQVWVRFLEKGAGAGPRQPWPTRVSASAPKDSMCLFDSSISKSALHFLPPKPST